MVLFAIGQSNQNQVESNSQTERPPMFALQVGISRYANKEKWAELKGSRNDVEQMRAVLTGERYKIPAENIRTLLDEQATKKRIFDEFQNHLIKNAREYFEKTGRRDAVVLFQFSGHGSQVPDTDGDEEDKKDETFVTYDSQDLPGKNFDITDDEIYLLTTRLSQYTDNIIYILDSCHSGSGTRDAEDVRRLPERKTVPVQLLKTPTRDAVRNKKADSQQTDLLPPSSDYIVISAARSEQLAGQKYYFPDEQAKEPVVFGYLSFYLIEELKNARSNTTYRELMEKVRRKVVADKPSQVPQLEGDGGRFVFGGLGSREDNFIRILETQKETIAVQAGAMQGIAVGTLLAVYDKTTTHFEEAEKIASAKVTKVLANRSVAEVILPKREITINDKAVVIAPDFGALRLKVFLEADESKLSASERIKLQALREKFTPAKNDDPEPRGVDLLDKAESKQKANLWNVAVLKDSFGKVFSGQVTSPVGGDEKMPALDKQIFYLAGNDFVPLYGFYVETDREDAVQKLEKALVHLARLRMVHSIANDKSPLKSKISVKPVRLIAPKCINGKIAAEKLEIPELNPARTAYKFSVKQAFWLEVTNNSKKELYVALLGIGTDGSVKVHFPRPVYEENDGVKIVPGGKRIILGEKCSDQVLGTTPPAGLETFKIIVSTEPIKSEDFKYLEMAAITKSRNGEKSLTGLGDWTTAEIVFEILENKQ